MYVDIDLETRSRLDLKKVGAYKYSTDCEILCACTFQDDVYIKWFEGSTNGFYSNVFKKQVQEWIDAGAIFRAHNAAFEWCVIKHQLGIEIPFSQMRCSMALAAYHNLPMSLGLCSKTLGLTETKDDPGRKLMLKLCKPARNGEFVEPDPHMKELIGYCEQDVRTETAIFDRLGELPEQEQKIWEIDMEMNYKTGVKVDVELCEKAVKLFEEEKVKLNRECEESFGFKLSQVKKIAEFCEMESVGAADIKEALANDIGHPAFRVLEMRQAFSNTSPTKYQAVLNAQVDGYVYGLMQYSGATQTHRWAGRLVQIQNLPRGSFHEDWVEEEMELTCFYIKNERSKDLNMSVMDALKSCVRGIFIGDLSVCDYAQIEARVLPWLAGDTKLLKVFEDGVDLYKYTASQIYKKPMDEVTKPERFIGKVATLALGFAGGVGAFKNMAKIYGLDIDDKFADEIKVKWREANPKIVSLWHKLEKTCVETVKFKRSEPHRVGKVTVRFEDEFLKIRLPSGSDIMYYKPKLEKNTFGDQITYVKDAGRVSTYSGKLVENITQKVARDVLAEALTALPPGKLSFMVHDELVCRDYPLPELESKMLAVPEWAVGLPIGVDGWSGDRYRK